MNTATTNIFTQVFMIRLIILRGYIARIEIAGLVIGRCVFKFIKYCYTVFQRVLPSHQQVF